jgi:hypothetical protein
MAKGNVTDEDFASSLRSLGGLGGIASSGARRDSPFGSDFARKVPPDTSSEPRPAQPDVEKTIDLKPAREIASAPAVTPLKDPGTKLSPPPRVAVTPKPREKAKPIEIAPRISTRKLDSFSEKVTIQMAPDMRDELNLTASKLQRRKTDKSERITANTLMRIAIRILLDEVDLEAGEIGNTEEELLRIAREKIRRS